MGVKIPGVSVFSVRNQGVCGDMGASDQAAIYGRGKHSLARAAPLFVGAAGKASKAKAGDWIAGQFLPVFLY